MPAGPPLDATAVRTPATAALGAKPTTGVIPLRMLAADSMLVVDGVVYLPDMAKFPDMNIAYREIFSKDFPARATVGTGLMGADAAVEIMFTAVK